jgi:hypothetical protein
MRSWRSVALVGAAWLGGCGGGALSGTWIGDLTCDAFEFDLELALEKDGKAFVGDGVQAREFTNTEGERTDERIEFTATLTMDGGGAQDLETELVCTHEDTVVFPAGGGDPVTVDEGCRPRRFEDYVVAWDGKDTLTVSGADGCEGQLTRRAQ